MLPSLLLVMYTPGPVEAQSSGVELWAQTCGNCHQIQTGDRYTADAWVTIMDNMKIVARLTDAEADAILAFLQSGARKLAVLETPSKEPVASVQTLSTTPAHGPSDGGFVSVRSDAKEIFKSLCAACHGEKGDGKGPAAVALNPRPANFTDSEFQKSRLDSDLQTTIHDGKGLMPPFKDQLTDVQISDLVKYIRSFAR